MIRLLADRSPEQSSVVANSLMNRESRVVGSNSYAKDWHFNPLTFLSERLQHQRRAVWFDLCCGTGRALMDLPFAYPGADEQAGPNYTGQAAVDSYYRKLWLSLCLIPDFSNKQESGTGVRIQPGVGYFPSRVAKT